MTVKNCCDNKAFFSLLVSDILKNEPKIVIHQNKDSIYHCGNYFYQAKLFALVAAEYEKNAATLIQGQHHFIQNQSIN